MMAGVLPARYPARPMQRDFALEPADTERLANLATGDGRSPGTDGIVITDWLPRNAAGGRLGVTGAAPIAGWSGTFFICQDNLSGSFARQIDIAMDDGLPASGSVRLLPGGAANGVAINQAAVDAPEAINSAPYDNWLFRIKPADPDELSSLLDADGYNATL